MHVQRCDSRLLEVALRLGYFTLACSEVHADTSKGFYVRVFEKAIITAERLSDLRSALRDVNYKKVFVTVYPVTVETARWAAHDSRVDSILMTPENMKIFDKRQASVMKYYAKALEVHLPHLLYTSSELRGMLYRRLNMFVRSNIAFVVGSSAREWVDLVPPISLIKLLSTQYDIPEKTALLSLTDVPRQILSSKGVQ
ncbi:MAG: hypothetical protein QW432_02270 [Desulfurococcaceae archaeon]